MLASCTVENHGFIGRDIDVSGCPYRMITAKEKICCPYVLRRRPSLSQFWREATSYHQGGSRRVAHRTQTRASVTWPTGDSTRGVTVGRLHGETRHDPYYSVQSMPSTLHPFQSSSTLVRNLTHSARIGMVFTIRHAERGGPESHSQP
jgi:hypothetical protein